MKLSNQIAGLCLVVGLFLATPATAEECCNWNGCFSAGAELLYWRPCKCEWTWAFKQFIPAAGERTQNYQVIKNRPDFGFCLYGTYNSESGCSFTTLSWTHLRATNSNRVGPVDPATGTTIFIIPLDGTYSEATASEKQEYDRVVLQVGRFLYRNWCANFYAYAGIEFIDVDQKHAIEALDINTLSEYQEKSEFYAFGFDLGIGGEYALGCGFNVSARTGGIAAVGRRKHRANSSFPITGRRSRDAALQQVPITAKFNYPSSIAFVPGVEAGVGLSYLLSCGRTEFEIEIGYAIEHYFNALDVSSAGGDASEFDSSCEDIGFAGPYLKVQFCF